MKKANLKPGIELASKGSQPGIKGADLTDSPTQSFPHVSQDENLAGRDPVGIGDGALQLFCQTILDEGGGYMRSQLADLFLQIRDDFLVFGDVVVDGLRIAPHEGFDVFGAIAVFERILRI
jgi:hypothetical protein